MDTSRFDGEPQDFGLVMDGSVAFEDLFEDTSVVVVQKLRSNASIPDFQSEGAAAQDLHANLVGREVTVFTASNEKRKREVIGETLTLRPGERALVPTGIATQLPPRTEALISLRGSATKRGMFMPNAPGIVDEDYRGEWFVPIANLSAVLIDIAHGERIAQVRVRPVFRFEWQEGDLEETERGSGMLGSTGTS